MCIEPRMKAQLYSHRDRDPKNDGRSAALTGPLPHAPRIGPRTAQLWSHKDPKDAFCAFSREYLDGAQQQLASPRVLRAITCARRRKPHACSRRSQRVGRAVARTRYVFQPINQHTTGTGFKNYANQALGGLRAPRGRRASTCNEGAGGHRNLA